MQTIHQPTGALLPHNYVVWGPNCEYKDEHGIHWVIDMKRGNHAVPTCQTQLYEEKSYHKGFNWSGYTY